MDDDDEIVYRLAVNRDRTVYTLTLESPRGMATNEFIMALEVYLTDISRAENQLKDPNNQIH